MNVKKPLTRTEAAGRNRKLIWSIVLRSAICLIVFAGLECGVGLCAWRWGAGDNLWQKITNSWQWHVVAFGLCVIAYRFLLGRERLRLLKFWKGDDIGPRV